MTVAEVAQLLTAGAAVIAALASLRNGRKIEEVRHATNSMKDELVAVARKDAKAEGVIEGREEGRRVT